MHTRWIHMYILIVDSFLRDTLRSGLTRFAHANGLFLSFNYLKMDRKQGVQRVGVGCRGGSWTY